ncbi:hypothetical protein QR680_003916 [Steinernema hermaphroditum]|uniref:Uncharacterized protein n=1 Tax=Steinernema hermaphroditum TaxID=289476 RepID=A0AA39LSD8_9BILA|nr:hypothetical protein QR680_003916 [Steinernema hermaphroditum]
MNTVPCTFIDSVLSLRNESDYSILAELSGRFGELAQIWSNQWFCCQIVLSQGNATNVNFQINKTKGNRQQVTRNVDLSRADLKYCKRVVLCLSSNAQTSKTAGAKQFTAFLSDLKLFRFKLFARGPWIPRLNDIHSVLPKDIVFDYIDTILGLGLDDIIDRSICRKKLRFLACNQYWSKLALDDQINLFVRTKLKILKTAHMNNVNLVDQLLQTWRNSPRDFTRSKALWGSGPLKLLFEEHFKKMTSLPDGRILAKTQALLFPVNHRVFFEMVHPKAGSSHLKVVLAFFSNEKVDEMTLQQCVNHRNRFYNFVFTHY